MRFSTHFSPADRMISAVAICLALASSGGVAQAASPDEVAFQQVNGVLINGHVIGAYEELARATGALSRETSAYCETGDVADLPDLKSTYEAAATAWMGAEHLRFGPSELFLRNLRMNFWPQARGKVATALGKLMDKASAGEDMDVSNGSFAIQGFPALEHLVYRDGGLLPNSPECKIAQAVAANMSAIAGDVLSGWADGTGDANTDAYVEVTCTPGSLNSRFATHGEVTLELFKSLHDGLQRISTLKLDPVLGSDLAHARPAFVEMPLSGLALSNVQRNIAALEDLYLGTEGQGLSALVVANTDDAKLDALMRKAFAKTRATAAEISRPLGESVENPEQRKHVEKLAKQLRALRQIIATRLSAALGLSTGFNSLDGD